MTDTARDYQTLTTADTNGMDDFFVAQDSSAQVIEIAVHGHAQDSPGQTATEAQDNLSTGWTVSEASQRLKISEKTVLRRLQKGRLIGYKVQGQFGLEWRVGSTGQLQGPIVEIAVDKAAQDNFEPKDRTAQDDFEGQDKTAQDSPAQLNPLITRIFDEQRLENLALRKQLEAATYRNGYLEAKLEEREQDIKLLTDSQHKDGWWAKFSSWFFKAQ